MIFVAIATIILGIMFPVLAMVVWPPRALYLLVKSNWLVRVLVVLWFVAWAYFAYLILEHGYVSSYRVPGGRGPTIGQTPMLAFALSCVAIEFIAYVFKRVAARNQPQPPTPPQSPTRKVVGGVVVRE